MNKSQREIRNANRRFRKNGDNSVLSTRTEFNSHGKRHTVHIDKAEHSGLAFMEPAEAIKSMVNRGKRSWKISKKHPANQKIKGPDAE